MHYTKMIFCLFVKSSSGGGIGTENGDIVVTLFVDVSPALSFHRTNQPMPAGSVPPRESYVAFSIKLCSFCNSITCDWPLIFFFHCTQRNVSFLSFTHNQPGGKKEPPTFQFPPFFGEFFHILWMAAM